MPNHSQDGARPVSTKLVVHRQHGSPSFYIGFNSKILRSGE